MVYTTLIKQRLLLIFIALFTIPTSQADPVSFQTVLTRSEQAPAATETLRYGELADHYGLLWLPQQATPAPLVVLVHGGCWLQNYDVNHVAAAAAALRDDGYAVWAPEYRRASAEQAAWPQALHDVVQAIDFIKTSKHPAIARQAPLLVGHSAGGHLALLASNKTAVKGVVGLAAITDFSRYAEGDSGCQQAARWLIGAAVDDPQAATLYQQANPRLQPLTAPIVLLASAADTIVPLAQAGYLADVEVVTVADAGHFDFIYPASAAWQQLRATLQAIANAPEASSPAANQ